MRTARLGAVAAHGARFVRGGVAGAAVAAFGAVAAFSAVAAVATLAGCGDSAIDMSLAMPTDPAQGSTFDMSCVTSVEVLAHGENWPGDPTDTKRSCIAIESGVRSLEGVQRALAGKFELPLPDSGLGSIEVNGRTGTCDPPAANEPPMDLLFYAGNEYLGADSIRLPVLANQSCAAAQVRLRMYDMTKLVTARTATATDCTNAMLPAGPSLDPGAGFGTFTPTLNGLAWSQGFDGGTYASGVVAATGHTTVGPSSCFGVNAGNDTTYTLGCVLDSPPLCAAPGELEVPVMDGQLTYNSLDATKLGKWGGLVIGSVWTVSGTAKIPAANATVHVDPAHGEVVYLAPNADTTMLVPSGTQTGPSGLFAIYTDAIVDATVTVGSHTRTIRVGAKTDMDFFPPAIAMVLVQ